MSRSRKEKFSGKGLPIDIDTLLSKLCEGTLPPESRDHLGKLLATSDEALQRYVEVMHLSTELIDWAKRDVNVTILETLLEDMACQSDKAAELDHLVSLHSQPNQSKPRASSTSRSSLLSRKMRWVAAIAASVIGIAIVPFLLLQNSERTLQADLSNRSAETEIVAANQPEFVAHILEATNDVTWVENAAPFDFLLRLGIGQKIAIQSGVLRLQYFSGAEIILHGPAEFIPTGPAGGHLASGRVTGKLSNSQEREFRLSTPSAEVIDLGTVFGVAISDGSDTDVCVFDGEVEVNSIGPDSGSSEPIRLVEGMSVRLTSDGKADLAAHVDREQFLSEIPVQDNTRLAANEISLIDAFIDGPGLSHRLFATLDPKTGKPDEDPSEGLRHGANSGYRLAVYSEFVDGVFIPSNSGKSVQLDSYGNTTDLPKTTGHINGTVWSRRPVPGLSLAAVLKDENKDEVWEMGATLPAFEHLADSRLGVIGLHSNVGITFDLLAIQSREGQPVTQFHCLAANLGGPVDDLAMRSLGRPNRADLRFYVDGVERQACFGIGRDEEMEEITVDIDAFSRVLTIVVTDAAVEEGYDQVLLVDPRLELAY